MEQFLKRTWEEIHLDRAERNLEILKKYLDTDFTAPACVIKANAYGHGDVQLMQCYQNMGVDFFTASNINEAVRLRDGGCKGDILILGWTAAEYAPLLSEKNIIQAVLSVEHAAEISAKAVKPVRVHIKLDTGMGRIGLLTDDISRCAKEIAQISGLENIVAEGIFTHFAVADSYDKDNKAFTEMQKKRFFDVSDEAEHLGIHLKHKHCLNSAGALLHYDKRSTLARLGIVLYGLKPDVSIDIPDGLEPIMELKSVVSYIKPLHKGDNVSYGRAFTADKEMLAATIPVGYADGYSRQLSGINTVLINGKRAKGIGRICMDQMMVDITDIPDVCEGTEVTLIGRNGDETITADDIATLYGTLGYEVICGISPRVPRVYLRDGKITEIYDILKN